MALSQDDVERAPWNGVLLALIAIIAVQAVIIAASSKQGKQRLHALREWVRASTTRHAPAAPAEPVSDAERAMRPLSQISVSQQKAIVADLVAASGAAHDQYAPDELWRSNSVLNERLDARLAQARNTHTCTHTHTPPHRAPHVRAVSEPKEACSPRARDSGLANSRRPAAALARGAARRVAARGEERRQLPVPRALVRAVRRDRAPRARPRGRRRPHGAALGRLLGLL